MSRLEDLAIAVHAQLDDSSIERVMFQIEQNTNRRRRRIHWYYEQSNVAVNTRAGGTQVSNSRQGSVYMRLENIGCLIFAENVDTLDTLFDNLLNAIDMVFPNNSSVLDGATYEFTEKAVNQRIPMAQLTFMVKWPVVEEIKQLTTITDAENTCEFEE